MMIKKIIFSLIVICISMYAHEHEVSRVLERENSSLQAIRDILDGGQMPSDDIVTWTTREEKNLSESSNQDRKDLGILLKQISENKLGNIDGTKAIATITRAVKTLDKEFKLGYVQTLTIILKGTLWWATGTKQSTEAPVTMHDNEN